MSLFDSNIFLLNITELCVTIFRGPDATTWSKMADSGVPELLDRVQTYPTFPQNAIRGTRFLVKID